MRTNPATSETAPSLARTRRKDGERCNARVNDLLEMTTPMKNAKRRLTALAGALTLALAAAPMVSPPKALAAIDAGLTTAFEYPAPLRSATPRAPG
jgi:hypothetical protein